MEVRFVQREDLGADIWEYTFSPTDHIDYVPGQYARFTFPFSIPDPRGKQHRTFSFISHPSELQIRFITRLDEPLSVFKRPLSELKPGDILHIDEPHGDAVLPRLDTIPVIFIAQGIALASYLSMLQDIKLRGLAHPVSLLWAHRADDSKLAALVPTITFRSRTELIHPQRLTVDHVLQQATPESLLYLSGSQTFVEMLGEALEASGIARERIIYDYYSGYTDL